MKKYDYILIGSGPAAYKLSNLLAKTSRKVLVVDGDEFGGTCPNYGCEPKIFLEGATRVVLQSQQLQGRGIKQAASIDWRELMATKLNHFNSWPEETKAIIAKSHDVESGYAHFVDDNTIEVNGHQYQSNQIVIATGQRSHRLAIPGEQFTHTSRNVLSLPHLPQHVTFIGGGYVAMELATVLGAAGASITIIDHSARPLKAFPASKVQVVTEAMEKRGIEFLMNTSVQGIRQQDEGFIVQNDQGEIPTDYVVDTSGRQPNIDRLALAVANVNSARGGIIVNEHLQTSNPNVYAIGDVISRPQPKLTPVAEFEGEYLFDYLEGKTTAAIKYPTIGTAAFTFPEIAEAGVKEEVARGNSQYQTKTLNLKYSSLAAGQNDQTGKLTLIFEGDALVGVSAVGDNAADDVNNFLPVIGLRITGEEYRQAIIAIYPALADKVAGGLI
ncbi:NAD(P)/FAD-dependent oxidoreductase [uncultured Limosilactobacillus sp.]|uniref:dihydrolipoyl dehydrogenase family protein n=1 Tax=uncultured Limosilactobacillus sp. TaxID=2837629 RepID=UPI0025896D7B|nr:NAD(P)/FAD-dependent oxidoreductase [uncultured Limosilactobacillus sp.]